LIDFKLISHDKRGESYSITFEDGREAMLIVTKKGFYRGGHYHTTDEISLLLSGSIKCWKKDSTKIYNTGELISNKAGEPHLTLALTDYVLLDWKPNDKFGEWETIEYEPYRICVTQQFD